jgi:hypothetical protein
MDNSFLEQITKLQDQYYSSNGGKNTFFKRNQKMECANTIAENIQIGDLLNQTAYVLPNTNRVFFDYQVFKTYANPSNYIIIITHVLSLFRHCIYTYGSYEAHVHMKTFSISAAERYKDMIQNFWEECFKTQIEYSTKLVQMYIYHTPSMVDNISVLLLPFVEKTVQERIVLVSKRDSDEKLAALFSQRG